MERNYNYLKLRRIRRFRNKKMAKRLFDSLETNMYMYKEELIKDFEDKLHVFWSWKVLLESLGLIFLFFSILNFNNIHLSYIFMGISVVSIIISIVLNNRMKSITRGYLLGVSVADQLINESQEKIRKTYNQ